jgi:preprotein translocase subunit YajC
MSLAPLSLLSAAANAAGAADGPPAWLQFAPFVLILVVMWFLIGLPQMRQAKAHKAKLEALKKGDSVLTGGGLLGKVLKVDGDYLDIELGANIKVRALKSTITDVIPPGGAAAAND